MNFLNSSYLNQITEASDFLNVDINIISFILILSTAFILGFTWLIVFLSINNSAFARN